jgi:hypothetical protein
MALGPILTFSSEPALLCNVSELGEKKSGEKQTEKGKKRLRKAVKGERG